MTNLYSIELTAAELSIIRRSLGRAPHDQVAPVIENIGRQVERIEAERKVSFCPSSVVPTNATAALLRAADDQVEEG
jgi:hypothetical protein